MSRLSLPRSVLFVPGDRIDLLAKAMASGADAVCLDLEDGVAPASKARARRNIASISSAPGESALWVRIGSELEAVSLDLAALPPSCAMVVLPKARSLDHVAQLNESLDRIGHKAGIVAMVESASGLAGMERAAPPPARLCAICIGTEDLSADLAVTARSPLMSVALSRLAFIAARYGVGLMGFAGEIADFDDLERFSAQLSQAGKSGSLGAFVIHPRQVSVANAAFSPDPEALERARRIVARFEKAARDGIGAISIDGAMVDKPVYERALALLARGEKTGQSGA